MLVYVRVVCAFRRQSSIDCIDPVLLIQVIRIYASRSDIT